MSGETDLHIALWHKIGRLEGISGIVVDILKGVVPVIIGYYLDFRIIVVVLAGLAAVAGQMWPVFQKFNGEKGNTTGGGMALALSLLYQAHLIIVTAAIIIFIGVSIRTVPRFLAPGQTLNERLKFGGPVSNSLPLGMVLGFAAMPLVSWIMKQPIEITISVTIVFILIVVRRLTVNLRTDLKAATGSVGRILVNRLLFDRSYF
jgi:glycerol-3-phosphate acyltransferase PlsY